MISRRVFIQGACSYAFGLVSLGSYSHLLEPRWIEIKNVVIKINALPKQFEGLTIAQLSDIHHCKYVPKEFIRKCVQKANALHPDIIVLTGDYIYGSNAFLLSVAQELAKLKAKEGIFAVLGNHDNREYTADIFFKKGIRVLINEYTPIYRKNDYLFLGGVDDLWEGEINLESTFQGTDNKPKILLSHNPDVIEMIQYTDIDFVMAGHTHGGQVNLPFFGPPVVYSKFGNRYAAGLFREGKTIMYVNKGIGISALPVRFFARPEITLFTLRSSSQIV